MGLEKYRPQDYTYRVEPLKAHFLFLRVMLKLTKMISKKYKVFLVRANADLIKICKIYLAIIQHKKNDEFALLIPNIIGARLTSVELFFFP